MCGRFALTTTPKDVRDIFSYTDQSDFPPRFNIAPTQPIATVRYEYGHRRFRLVRWGLIPSWVKDPGNFSLLINARAETAAEKPSFRAAMRHHRCLIPASGFYEWRRTTDGKQPFWIRPADGGVLAFAGLWETWSDPEGGDIDTGAILTIQSNRMMSAIHHRMPVILKPGDFGAWLDTANIDVREAIGMMRPIEDDYLIATPVSNRVNKVSNDDEAIQDPAVIDEISVPANQGGKQKGQPVEEADDSQLDLF